MVMRRWLSFMFNVYCHSLGVALLVAALFSIVFNIGVSVVYVIVVFGSIGIFAARLLLNLIDGKLDYLFVEDN
jgi:hypothetical protein